MDDENVLQLVHKSEAIMLTHKRASQNPVLRLDDHVISVRKFIR
jgi:hypothetical protein